MITMEFLQGFTLGVAIGIPAGWLLYIAIKGVIHVKHR